MEQRGDVQTHRRGTAELALFAAMGLFMAVIGPFGTDAAPVERLYPYWLICIVGGGAIGILADRLLMRFVPQRWPRVLASAAVMTPFVAMLVIAANVALMRGRFSVAIYLPLLWSVFVVSLPVMAVRALAWRPARTLVETRLLVAPPLPEAEAVFRRRLSAKRRTARLIAIEAEDHYLRVHTDAGAELITARLADALDELALAHGFRTHRSWWVAAEAIQSVRWRRGAGEALLTGEIVAPVSRSNAVVLKAAGW
jgi:hypothetical protein